MAEVAEPTSANEPVAESPVSTVIGEDGNFTENWMEASGIDENLRADPTLKSTKNLAGMASQLVNAQKLIGKTANMVIVPNEKSSQTEWDDYHKAGGRPDTPDEYTITHLEGVGEISPDVESAFKNLAHSEGLRPSTVQKLIELDDGRMMAMRQAMERQEENDMAEAEKGMKDKWGNAYEERLHLANRMIEENTTPETKAAVVDAVGNNVVVADFLANIAKKFVEHKIISADIDTPTPVEALAQTEELRNTPGYITGELYKTSPATHARITAEIAAITAKAYPEKGN